MPNHVTNIIKLEGDKEQIQKLFEAICNDEYGPGTIDFEKITPMPQSLDIESGSRTEKGLNAYYEFSLVYKELNGDNADYLNIPPKAEKAFLAQRNDISKDEWELGKAAFKNILQYGFADWYNWRVANWGTKWNAYGYDEHDDYSNKDTLEFLTAWSAPHPVISKLSEMFPEVEINHKWADEDMGYNVGEHVYNGGERIEENIPTGGSSEALKMAADIRDVDLSEYGYQLNEETGEYEYSEETEEVEDSEQSM